MRTASLLAFALALAVSAVAAQDGPANIGGVTYEYVDPGQPFRERPRPKEDWQPPVPTAAERTAGLLAYVTADPGDYRPYRVPRAHEHATRLSAFLARGEDEPVCFGLRALADLRGLALSLDTQGTPLKADVRHMHFWPQRTGWSSREWYMTPELLLPCRNGRRTVPTQRGVLAERPLDLKAGETAAFWVTLTAPPDARPGTYSLSLVARGQGRQPLRLPLRVELLPFRLQRPRDRYWPLYADTGRWSRMNDAQVMAELRDFARHGITGLVEMPLGTLDLSDIRSGRAHFDATPFRRLAALCKEAGLPGPHVCSYGGVPERVRDALGLQVDLMRGTWPEELKAGVAAAARAAVEATRGAPARWHFYGWDEPGGDNTYAIQDYECWHRGGATTYATSGDLRFLEKEAGAYLDAPCFVSGLIGAEANARTARQGCSRRGSEFWWYGTGSYVNPFPQEGCMFSNRYGAGLLFWKTGAKAEVSWTFCRAHEDIFNDFDGSRVNRAEPKDQVTAYPWLLRPDDWSTYQGAIPTIAWESLREGVDDYSYLWMLSQRIARARQSQRPAVRAAARRAQETLDGLVQAIPWMNPMDQPTFDTRWLQRVRRGVADQIVLLDAALAGKPVRSLQYAPTVTLSVRTVAPRGASAVALPVLGMVRAADPPILDGALDDPCWQEGTPTSPFRYVSSGQPAAALTQARAAYDDRALYVAFICREPAMARLVAERNGHDTPMVWQDDSVELFVAGPARERYAHLIVNSRGSVYDEMNQDPSWNPEVSLAVSKEADRWGVELALAWADLERAGVRKSPVMALNFCRNRFAARQDEPHTAWSPTGGGFHVPQRFGLAVLESGPVALSSIRLPQLWGRQHVEVRLRNTTDAPLTARAQVGGHPAQSVALAPDREGLLRLPVLLTRPGAGTITLIWGASNRDAQRVRLPVTVPSPIALPERSRLVSEGEVVELPLQVSLAHTGGYRIRAVASQPGKLVAMEMPARPGQRRARRLVVAGRSRVQVCLLGAGGRSEGRPLETTLYAAPQ